MPVAIDPASGKAVRLDEAGAWVPTQLARNPETGETLALDGKEWRPVKMPAPLPTSTDDLPEMIDQSSGDPGPGAGLLSRITGIAGGVGRDVQIGLHLIAASEPEELAKALEGVEGVTIRRAGGVPYATVNGKHYALNRKGLSTQDVVPFVTALAASVPIGRLVRILPIVGRIPGLRAELAREGLIGAGTGAAMAGAKQAAGVDQTAGDVATETAAGGAGGILGRLLATAIGGTLRTARGILDPSGQLTATASAAFRAAGIDIASLSRATLRQVDDALRGRQITDESVGATTRRTLADGQGMSLTRGQATRSTEQLTFEDRMLKGEKGPGAQRTMEDMFGRQQEQARQMVENSAQRLAPAATLGVNEGAVGDAVQQALLRNRQAARGNVRGLYGQAEQTMQQHGLAFPSATGPGGGPLTGHVRQTMSRDLPLIGPENAPTTTRAIDALQELEQGPVSPERVEQLRKTITAELVRLRNNPNAAQDVAGLGLVLRELDAWVDRGAASLPTQAGNAVVQQLRDARAAHRDFKQMFTPQSPADRPGRFMQQTTGSEYPPTGQEVFDRLAGGSNLVTPAAQPIVARAAQVLGQNAPVLDDVKRGLLRRVLLGDATKQAGTETPTWTSMLRRVNDALEGRGSASVAEALGTEGRQILSELRTTLQALETPRSALNPSGSGSRINIGKRELLNQILWPTAGAVLGGIGAGTLGGTAGAGAGLAVKHVAKAIGDYRGYRAAQRAAAPYVASLIPRLEDELLPRLGMAAGINLGR